MGEVIELNRCDNCGARISRDYGRKLPRWFHIDTGSPYCQPNSLNVDRDTAEPRD